jgi:hypothetical protein
LMKKKIDEIMPTEKSLHFAIHTTNKFRKLNLTFALISISQISRCQFDLFVFSFLNFSFKTNTYNFVKTFGEKDQKQKVEHLISHRAKCKHQNKIINFAVCGFRFDSIKLCCYFD